MQQHALAFLHAQRLARPKHSVVDGRVIVDNLLIALAAALGVALPVVQRQKNFLVVARRIILWIDHQKSKLGAVGCAIQVVPRRRMRVVPAESGRPGYPCETLCSSVGRRLGRAFLRRAILQRWNLEAVPVHDVRDVGFVDHVEGHPLPFAHTNQFAWHAPIECSGLHHFAGRNLQPQRRDADRVVGRSLLGEQFQRPPHRQYSGDSTGAANQKISSPHNSQFPSESRSISGFDDETVIGASPLF